MLLFGKLNRKNIYLFVISFFGTGLISKKIPGTIGSFFASLLVLILPKSISTSFIIAFILFFIGILSCKKYIPMYEIKRDPGYIVIDEACGIFFGCGIIYLFGLNSNLDILFNFLLFRVFDIWKPFPIKKIESILKKNDKLFPIGIMLDDVISALFASILQVIIVMFIRNM